MASRGSDIIVVGCVAYKSKVNVNDQGEDNVHITPAFTTRSQRGLPGELKTPRAHHKNTLGERCEPR